MITVGKYRSHCLCSKTFLSTVDIVQSHAKYTNRVRELVANSVVRDRLPYRLVQQRFEEDFYLHLSIGYIHACFFWAHGRINHVERREWIRNNFSGVLCIDEVHDSGRVIVYATDPLNDYTVDFSVHEKNDQEHMDLFLNQLKSKGIKPQVIITDGSPLYKDSLQEVWQGVEHQLCIFHVIKEVNKLVLNSIRSIKNAIKRQGNKGRNKKRGRVSDSVKKQRQANNTKSNKAKASFLWDNQYLIVRKESSMSDEEKDNLKQMIDIAPEVQTLRDFTIDFYNLFEKGISIQQARYRRTRLVNNKQYQANNFLNKALKKVEKNKFEKMIVFLSYEDEDAQKTSNHVERNNRSFRMMQKTRYKRRKSNTIIMAIDLFLERQLIKHPLYKRCA